MLKDINELEGLKTISVAIGNFDGVHLGHQEIIKRIILSPHSLIVTFSPHPTEILSLQEKVPVITPVEEKAAIIEGFGVENLFVLQFSTSLASMEAEDFVKWLVVECIKPQKIVTGYNHQFGCNAKGDYELLVHMGAKFGFEVIRVPPVYVDGFPVSSTWVRRSLLKGDIELANKLLGRPYSIVSQVIPGDKRGSKLSYPTANLCVPENKLIPQNGVYAVWIEYRQEKLAGMMHVGNKPTIPDSYRFGMEVHIFDFNKNLVGEGLRVEFVKYLRDTVAFPSLEALKTQLQQDEKIVRQLLLGNR